MRENINSAIILCAGFGGRMGEVTQHIPKPMVRVAGRSLIERTLVFAYQEGIGNFIINLHYKADMLKEHIQSLEIYNKANISFSYEEELLDTGGGTKKVLDFFEGQPFFTFNCDQIWLPKSKIIASLKERWDSSKMKSILLLHPKESSIGHQGVGDFDISKDGYLIREFARKYPLPYIYTGMQLTSYKFFENSPEGAFSFYQLFKNAEVDGELLTVHGLVGDGYWLDVGTKEGLARAQEFFAKAV